MKNNPLNTCLWWKRSRRKVLGCPDNNKQHGVRGRVREGRV
jgi:hypothetical protein